MNNSSLTLRYLLFVFTLALLSGCANKYDEQIQLKQKEVQAGLLHLGDTLDSRSLTNAKLVDIYAKKLTQLKPELKPFADSMAKDSTRQGVLYQGLEKRLKQISLEPGNKQNFNKEYQALMSISSGSDPVIFNDSLLDLINTMADLSDGELNRLSIPKSSQTDNVKSNSVVPGSYLVGNPGYGEYRSDSSGRSLWHWYGQYAFFRSLFSGPSYYNRPIYYDSWNSRPRHSYYRDYGMDTYGSYESRSNTRRYDDKMRSQGKTPAAKPKKQYGSVQGQKRTSTYSKQRSNFASNSSKKYGSSNSGPRHSDKKKSSSYLNNDKKTSSTSSTSTSAKRSSSFFNSSSSSSRSSYRGGGK